MVAAPAQALRRLRLPIARRFLLLHQLLGCQAGEDDVAVARGTVADVSMRRVGCRKVEPEIGLGIVPLNTPATGVEDAEKILRGRITLFGRLAIEGNGVA